MTPKIDQYDFRILELLQQNARISHAEIGRRVHLSQPAVSERIRRLEGSGVISGYRAHVDPAKLGYTICAMVRVRADHHGDYERFVRERPEIVECRTVTGDDCAVMRVLATDVAHLQSIIAALNRFGATSTAIVLSTDVDHKPVRAPLSSMPTNAGHMTNGAAAAPTPLERRTAGDLASAQEAAK